MLLIDNGKLIKTPFKWLYTVFAILAFIPLLAFLGCAAYFWDDGICFLGVGFWNIFVTVFIAILFAYSLLIIALGVYNFWINRKIMLDKVVKTGSRIFAIPLIADINQCLGESNSIQLVAHAVFAVILAFISLVLTGGCGFYYEGHFILYPLIAVAGLLIVALLAYLNVLTVRFVAEKLRIRAGLANDVRDIRNGVKDDELNDEEKSEMELEPLKFTPKEKRITVFSVVAAAVVAAVVALIIMVPVWNSLKEPVNKSLDEESLEKVCRMRTGFQSFYYETQKIAEKSSHSYSALTYGRLYEYENKYYDNSYFRQSVKDEKKDLQKVLKEIDELCYDFLQEGPRHLIDDFSSVVDDCDEDDACLIPYETLRSRKLVQSDIAGMSSSDLRLIRNEIYARHGYIFKSSDLKEYFSQFSWYEPRSRDVSDMLSETELYNVTFIKKYE